MEDPTEVKIVFHQGTNPDRTVWGQQSVADKFPRDFSHLNVFFLLLLVERKKKLHLESRFFFT